ncbi:molybdate ABC transporter substrate-binding protein [Lachnospiraceae bacterium SGI.085]
MVTAVSVAACGNTKTNDTDKNTKDNTTETASETTQIEGTVTIAAAASLEKVFNDELIPMFNEMYPDVTVEGTYDSSGKLQTQIEEGADVDVFFSAATKQMDALKDEGMMEDDSIVDLLENKIVLIVPGGEEGYSKFEDIVNAQPVAIGDPESVPAGQYGKEALTNLNLWDQVEGKLSLGTNVTEVLNWVAASSAQAGIVYATDAASMPDQVDVVAEAPEGSCTKVIYPVGMLKNSKNPEAAKALIAFLQTDQASKVFEDAGFTIVE